MAKGKSRGSTEINASSMADIAFLLLIFFLVTTTIDQDKGILHGLPPWSEDEPPPVDLREKNVLEILVNANNQLLVEGEYMDISELREITMKHISNNGKLPNFSVSPDKAIVSLKNDRGTSYDIYIQIQNELKAAYSELRDIEADKLSGGNMTYKQISDCADPLNQDTNDKEKKQCKAWKGEIKELIPMKISEAEPENVGGV
ncbi:MAG: ExbD/TolR family protein [Chitinophagales bacterium]